MWHGRLFTVIAGSLLILSVAASTGAAAPAVGQWRVLLKVPGIVDVAGPRADGQLVLSTKNGLFLLRPGRGRTAVRERARRLHGRGRRAVHRARVRLARLGRGRVLVRAGRRVRARRRLDAGHRPRAAERSGVSLPRLPVRRLPLRDRIRPLRPFRLPAARDRHLREQHQDDPVRDRLPRPPVRDRTGRRTWKGESWSRRRPSGVSAAS